MPQHPGQSKYNYHESGIEGNVLNSSGMFKSQGSGFNQPFVTSGISDMKPKPLQDMKYMSDAKHALQSPTSYFDNDDQGKRQRGSILSPSREANPSFMMGTKSRFSQARKGRPGKDQSGISGSSVINNYPSPNIAHPGMKSITSIQVQPKKIQNQIDPHRDRGQIFYNININSVNMQDKMGRNQAADSEMELDGPQDRYKQMRVHGTMNAREFERFQHNQEESFQVKDSFMPLHKSQYSGSRHSRDASGGKMGHSLNNSGHRSGSNRRGTSGSGSHGSRGSRTNQAMISGFTTYQ